MKKLSLLEAKRQQWAKEREEMASAWCPWGKSSIPPFTRTSPGPPSHRSASLPPLRKSSRTPRNSTSCKIKAIADTVKNHGEKEAGDTSGYQSEGDQEQGRRSRGQHVREDFSCQVGDQRFMERRRWMTETFFHPYMWPYHTMPPMPGPFAFPDEKAKYPQQFQPFPWITPAAATPSVEYPHPPMLSPQLPPVKAPPTPKWLERSIGRDNQSDAEFVPEQHFVTSAAGNKPLAQTFLRGQKAPLEPEDVAERELKRRQATELQNALLKQLEEKERKKKEEREKRLKEEAEEEARLQRQRELEKQLYEHEQRQIFEKKIKERQKQEMMEEALLQAREAAMREKQNRKKSQACHDTPTPVPTPVPPTVCQPVQPISTKNSSVTNTPREMTAALIVPRSSYREVGTSPRTEVHKDIGVQTDNTEPCTCRKQKNITEEDNAQEKDFETKSSSSATSKPAWGRGIPKVRYQRQSEKDPKYQQRKREKQRRLQRAMLEKQMHGSRPSSDNSSGEERIILPSKVYFNNAVVTEFKESKDAEVPMEKPASVTVAHENISFMNLRTASPPVPAVLRKLQKMQLRTEEHEKQEYEVPEKWDKENLTIYSQVESKILEEEKRITEVESSASIAEPNNHRQTKSDEILRKLNMLRQGLEKKREDFDQMSIGSTDSLFSNRGRQIID